MEKLKLALYDRALQVMVGFSFKVAEILGSMEQLPRIMDHYHNKIEEIADSISNGTYKLPDGVFFYDLYMFSMCMQLWEDCIKEYKQE